jgi:hypothetical protein
MNTLAPEHHATFHQQPSTVDWFSATDIARAVGLKGEAGKKMIKRTATMEAWPRKFVGNKLVFVPPPAIAEIILTPPALANEEDPAPTVRFCDLAHSPSARETVLLREKAVQRVQDNVALGKEVALKLVASKMAADHPLFRIGVSSLRQWCDKYEAAGLDGLVEQKRGVVGRKPFAAQLDEEHLLAAAAGSVERGIKGKLNIARGYRDSLVNNPTVTGPVRMWLHGENASKSRVPDSVRVAIRDRVSPLATTLIQIGPKAAKLAGPYTESTYENLKAGQAFTADDMTANCYVWTEWPNEAGFLLIRPQILAAMDVGSMSWLTIRAVIRPKGQYNKDDVWGLVGDVFDDYGLFGTAIFEGGSWQSNEVVGHNTGTDDETRFGGLKSLGVNLIHTRSPRGKIIETAFNSLQHAADNVRGFCGRMEMKDCPEIVRKQLALVKAGHNHPREFFLHINEYTKHLQGVMNALNHERGDGKILRGRAPVDKWAEDAPMLPMIPDEFKWMYRASYRVVSVTRNGVRITVGSGKYQTNYTYSNPAALENNRGRKAVVYWNDSDPDTDAIIYTLRNGKPDKFLCVASRVQAIPRLGASQEQMSAEATRKKLSMQHARTQRASLAPYLQRQERVITPPAAAAAPSDVAQRLEAAKTDNEVRQRNKKTVRDFVGDASALLGAEISPGTEAESNDEAKPRTSAPVESSLGNSLSETGGKKTYVLKSTGTDKTEYVDYLLQRLTQFRKAGTSYGQHHHAAVTLGITQKIVAGQLKCDVHDESRFDEICAHLKEKIDATILGKNNASKGRPNYHGFEPITDLSAEALLG